MMSTGQMIVLHETGELDPQETLELNERLVERIVRYRMPSKLYEEDAEFRERLAYGPGKSS